MSQVERRQKQGTAASFDQAASAYDRIGPRFFVHFGEHLVEQAEIQAGANVLDVACGRGAVLYPAARRVGASGLAIGIDLSGAMLRETAPEIASLGLKNIQLLQMDAEHLAFADSSFDFAFCALAIFFFPRPQLGLAEMYRVLKPGGQIGITSFADDCETTHRQRELFNRYMAVSSPPSGDSSQLLEMPFGTSDLLGKALREVGFIRLGTDSATASEMDQSVDCCPDRVHHSRGRGLCAVHDESGGDSVVPHDKSTEVSGESD